jgi:hypothetical protein
VLVLFFAFVLVAVLVIVFFKLVDQCRRRRCRAIP